MKKRERRGENLPSRRFEVGPGEAITEWLRTFKIGHPGIVRTARVHGIKRGKGRQESTTIRSK